MPPQDRADRVARKPRPAGGANRRLSGLGQALPDELFEIPSLHRGINTTISETAAAVLALTCVMDDPRAVDVVSNVCHHAAV